MKVKQLNRLAVVLKEKSIKNKTLAKGIMVTTNMISRYCRNLSQPTLRRLYVIAEFLRVDPRELLMPMAWPKDEQSPAEIMELEELNNRKPIKKKASRKK